MGEVRSEVYNLSIERISERKQGVKRRVEAVATDYRLEPALRKDFHLEIERVERL